MSQPLQFRRVLPVLQTCMAIFFGGWGLWLRNSILSQPFFGSTGWNSTARFHVWPWQFKFAAILNFPAVLAGVLLSLPLDFLRPGLPEWIANIPALLLIPFLWYLLGSRMDKYGSSRNNGRNFRWQWMWLFLFIFICAAASSISGYVGGYTSYLGFGIAIWVILATAMKVFPTQGEHKSRIASSSPSFQ